MAVTSIYKRYKPAKEPQNNNNAKAWMFVFNADQLLVKETAENLSIPTSKDTDGWLSPSQDRRYLGELEGMPSYYMEVDATDAPPGLAFRNLRSLLGQLDEDIFLLAGRASQLINWNRMTSFCGKCGTPTELQQSDLAKKCPRCKALFYPRLSPAIIVAVIKDDKILLAHNKNFKKDFFSVIAGFIEPGETFEDCVKREVMEEVGIKVTNVKYFGSQPWPFPDSLMVGFTAEYESGEIVVDGVEIEAAHWYKRDNLPALPAGTTIAGRLTQAFVQGVKY